MEWGRQGALTLSECTTDLLASGDSRALSGGPPSGKRRPWLSIILLPVPSRKKHPFPTNRLPSEWAGGGALPLPPPPPPACHRDKDVRAGLLLIGLMLAPPPSNGLIREEGSDWTIALGCPPGQGSPTRRRSNGL